jgi:hypothetical protein
LALTDLPESLSTIPLVSDDAEPLSASVLSLWQGDQQTPRRRDLHQHRPYVGALCRHRHCGRAARWPRRRRLADPPAGLDDAHTTLAALTEAGVDMAAVAGQLEAEGVALFAESYADLLRGVEEKRQAIRTAS